jgi:hypothetical protein
MDKFTKTAVVGNVVVTIGILLVLLFGAGKTVPSGNYLVDAGNSPSYGATASGLASVVFSHLTNLEANQNLGVISTFFQGASAETGNPLQVNVTAPAGSINCNTGTSTLFAVKPPSGATSTVTFLNLQGNVAQISDIVVGTSTAAGGMTATSTLNVTGSGGLFGAAAVAIGHFYTIAGLKVGPGTGYTTIGNGPYGSQTGIVVGPNEYLVGYATSTAVTGGNGASACSYKIEWYN